MLHKKVLLNCAIIVPYSKTERKNTLFCCFFFIIKGIRNPFFNERGVFFNERGDFWILSLGLWFWVLGF